MQTIECSSVGGLMFAVLSAASVLTICALFFYFAILLTAKFQELSDKQGMKNESRNDRH